MKPVLIFLTAILVLAFSWRFVARRCLARGKGAAVSHLSGFGAGFLLCVLFLFVAAIIDGPTTAANTSSPAVVASAVSATAPGTAARPSGEGKENTNVEKLAASDSSISALPVSAPSSEGELTGPQTNAARSAKQYLSMQGFSRKGLIQQLSSDAGEGYEIADATAAVDSLNVDWNQQAVRSAKQYLSMQGFSCKGLIQQLSSSAGEGYTVKQATYGAKQAGAC